MTVDKCDRDRMTKIHKRLNSYGSVDATDVGFLFRLVIKQTAKGLYLMDEEDALKTAKKLWREE